MKKLLCTLLCALLALAALPVLAEEAPVFLLRQSDYMKSLSYEDVALDHVPERVACMTTYPFRVLYELGVNFVAVAETSTFEYPEEIQPLVVPAVMSSTFDLEGIVALEPDLVILSAQQAAQAEAFDALEIPCIVLAPETLEEEVLQNVAIIVSTPKFSVPLDRGLGLAQRFIDKPIQVAQSILISEVLDAVEEYEPRAEVTNVTFEKGETPGLLVPVLEVNIVDNEE